ncbi:MAG: hypothetical protein CO095_00855, partial [Armatimonadetes bacterium CG_4_9_14_3_um_filter_58_7]
MIQRDNSSMFRRAQEWRRMLLVVSALVLVKPGLCFSQSEGGGTRLTLDESIRIALENNPGVETAERGRRAAQERIPQAKAQFG